MSQRRFKPQKKKYPATYPVDDTDILAAWHLDSRWPPPHQVLFFFQVFKHAFLENARILAKPEENGFLILACFLDEAARDRAIANIRATGEAVKDFEREPPASRGKGYTPCGAVLPKWLLDAANALSTNDADLALDAMASVADRMDRDPHGDYIFPNLNPDQYAAVRAMQKRKPQ